MSDDSCKFLISYHYSISSNVSSDSLINFFAFKMHPDWQQFLQQHHAIIRDGAVVHYGEQTLELEHTGTNTIMADLSHQGLIGFSGEDAQTFLQSQLTCDVNEVYPHKAQYGSYCTPKGRILANFLLWQKEDDFLISLPASLCAAILKRLSMFVLRAKVKVIDCSNRWIRIGIAGKQAAGLIEEILETKFPGQPLDIIHKAQTSIICHAPNRFELITPIANAAKLWERLSKQAKPAGKDCWDLLNIQAGIPVILPDTQEQFLPQMVNLDILGGVSFKKGCYPGQEIVARTKYLGKLKRRMVLAHVASTTPVTPGDDLFSIETAEQSCGKVVNAAPSLNGGYEVLAVIQLSSVESDRVFWKSLDGPELKVTALPYSLD